MAVQVVVWLLAVVVQVTVEQGSPLAPVVVVVAHRASRLGLAVVCADLLAPSGRGEYEVVCGTQGEGR